MENIIKQKNGQAGPDGNSLLRTRRIELRVSPTEYVEICLLATSNGFNSVAQYVREHALTPASSESSSSRYKAVLAATWELNKIGVNINQISHHLNAGHTPDEEMLMILLQIQDLAQENLKKITTGIAEKL